MEHYTQGMAVDLKRRKTIFKWNAWIFGKRKKWMGWNCALRNNVVNGGSCVSVRFVNVGWGATLNATGRESTLVSKLISHKVNFPLISCHKEILSYATESKFHCPCPLGLSDQSYLPQKIRRGYCLTNHHVKIVSHCRINPWPLVTGS